MIEGYHLETPASNFRRIWTGSSTSLVFFSASEYHLNMLDWTKCSAVERSDEKVSGAWVFRQTRVPVAALFENLEGGATVEQFLEWFSGVTREQVDAVLEHAARSLLVA